MATPKDIDRIRAEFIELKNAGLSPLALGRFLQLEGVTEGELMPELSKGVGGLAADIGAEAAQGATLGFADELASGAEALGVRAARAFQPDAPRTSIPQLYRQAQARRQMEAASREEGLGGGGVVGARLAGGLAPALFTGGATAAPVAAAPARVAPSLGMQVAKTGLIGGSAGAVAGAGEAKRLEDVPEAMLRGGGTGALLGGALPPAVMAGGAVARPVGRMVSAALGTLASTAKSVVPKSARIEPFVGQLTETVRKMTPAPVARAARSVAEELGATSRGAVKGRQERVRGAALRAFEEGGVTPEAAGRRLAAAEGAPLSMLELGGEGTMRQARAINTAGGRPSSILSTRLQQRGEGARTGVQSKVESMLGEAAPERGIGNRMEELLLEAREGSGPYYEALRQAPKLDKTLFNRSSPQYGTIKKVEDAASSSPRVAQAFENARKALEFTRPGVAPKPLFSIDGTEVKLLRPLDPSDVDTLVRLTDEMVSYSRHPLAPAESRLGANIEYQLKGFRKELDKAMRESGTIGGDKYRAAREAFGAPARKREAMEAGGALFSEQPVAIDAALEGATLPELGAYRQGVAGALETRLGTRPEVTSGMVSSLRAPNVMERLGRALPDEASQRPALEQFLGETEEALRSTQTVTGGSQTAARLTDLQRMGEGGEAAAGVVGDIAQANIPSLASKFGNSFVRVARGLDEADQAALARYLTQFRDPALIQRELRELSRIRDATRRALVIRQRASAQGAGSASGAMTD